jgi:hypothetical protein
MQGAMERRGIMAALWGKGNGRSRGFGERARVRNLRSRVNRLILLDIK